jgi:hypothetical protein
MTAREIARKLCEDAYLRQREGGEKEATYSFEEYWERNEDYFIGRAGIYLEVKGFLKGE